MFSLKILLRLSLLGLLLIPVVSGVWASTPASTPAQPAGQQINLLENPGFENPYTQQTNDVSVAAGWTAWWVEPGSSPAFPAACNYNVDPPSCQPYKRPSFQASGQVHGGAAAQKYFTSAAIHQAGLYQQITGVTPGFAYHFAVQVETLSVNSAGGTKSAGQPSMSAQVGIDPEGGTDPSGKGIIWNQAQNAFDAWTELSVNVAARSSTITVFIRTWPQLALVHNDVFVDDAILSPLSGVVLTSGPDSFLTPPDLNITQAPIATLFATSTALPNGEIWYTIQPGDTLVRIAHLHNTTVDELRFLNNLSSNKIVSGQKMLVAVLTPDPTATPFQVPTSTLIPSPTVSGPPTIPPLVTAQITANYGQLCVVAYNDANRNAINDHEPPVSEARITLSVGGSPLEGYVTTEGEATHCFPQLPAGTYQVTLDAPSGYVPTTAREAAVQLQAGNLLTLAFGLGAVEPTATATATPLPPEPPSSTTVFLTGMSALTVFILILGVVLFLWLKRK